jgi:Tol biopolymer transport system component
MPVRGLVCALLLLGLTGCQELRGPVWSPDGTLIAYTTYSRPEKPTEPLETGVYLADPDDATGTPTLLAENAAFPNWSMDGSALYLLGHRRGAFYTSILCHRPGGRKLGEGMLETVLQDNSFRLVGFQMSVDGTAAILCSARTPKLGAPQTLEFMQMRERTRVSLNQLGEVYSPALSPNGRVLAYSQRPAEAEKRPFVAVLELDRKPLQQVPIFPTAEFDEPAASHYIIHFFPDSDQLLFYAPFGKSIWTSRRDGKKLRSFPLPAGYSAPLLVTMSGDGRTAAFTFARPVDNEIQYDVYELNLGKGNFRRLDGGATDLMGGHVPDPRTARGGEPTKWAWLSPAGLAVGSPQKAVYFPRTSKEWLAASEAYLRQNEAQKALDAAAKAREVQPPPLDAGALWRAEARAALATGNGAQAASAWEHALLQYPVGPNGLPWVFPPDSRLPNSTDVAAALKNLATFSAAAPENKLLGALHAAFAARAKGQSKEALDLYAKAVEMCSSEAMVAGVKFQAGLAAYEGGLAVQAGEHWESAARCAAFPHAEYASGLSAMAYKLDGRPGMNERADAALRLGITKNSALKNDLLALPRDLHGRTYKAKRVEAEQKSPDQALRAWFEITEYELPSAYLRPRALLDSEGKDVLRLVGCQRVTISELNVAGLPAGAQVLARVPFPVSTPLFSPEGKMIAFQAQGDLFPKGRGFCEVYVVDLSGTMLQGNMQALANGRLSTRTRLTSLQWAGPQALTESGTTIDALGSETPFQKNVVVTPR